MPDKPPIDEKEYLQWLKDLSSITGVKYNPDDPLYDYRAAYREGELPQPTEHGDFRWTDKYKAKDYDKYIDHETGKRKPTNMGLLGIIPDEATRSLLSFFGREKPLTGDPLWDAAIRHAMMVATPQHMPYGNAWLGKKIPPEQAAVNDRIAPDANSLLQMLMQHIKRNEELKKLFQANPEKYGR